MGAPWAVSFLAEYSLKYIGVDKDPLEFGFVVLNLGVRLTALLLQPLGVVLLITVGKLLQEHHVALVPEIEDVGGRYYFPEVDIVFLDNPTYTKQ